MTIRRRPLALLAVACLLTVLAVGAVPATAATPPQVFASFDGAGAGELDGVGFTITGCDPGTASTADLSGGDFVPAGTSSEPTISCTTPWTVLVTFDEPIDDLDVYLVDAPYGVCTNGDYTFGGDGVTSAAVGSGLTAATVSGTTLTIPFETLNSGVVHVTGAVTTLSITSDARANQVGAIALGTVHVVPATTTTSTTAPPTSTTTVPLGDVADAAAAVTVTPAFTC